MVPMASDESVPFVCDKDAYIVMTDADVVDLDVNGGVQAPPEADALLDGEHRFQPAKTPDCW